MRIIDKRKDYYDGVMPYSDLPVYVRKESSFVLQHSGRVQYEKDPKKRENPYELGPDTLDKLYDSFRSIPRPHKKGGHCSHDFPFTMVVVCGKPYVCYHLNQYLNRPQDLISAATPTTFAKKCEGTDTYCLKEDRGKGLKYRYFYGGLGYKFTDKGLQDWYNEFESLPLWNDLHITFDSPIFSLSRRNDLTLTINPLLGNIGFQSVVDPWTMFTEIEHYLGNVLVKDPLADFKQTDEDKRDSKGMDEWSFKQVGPKKRKLKK